MKPFISGSYAYGSPYDHSDLDVVLKVDDDLLKALIYVSDQSGSDIGRYHEHTSLRFGNLNIIACHTDDAYVKWSLATKQLIKRKEVEGRPITHDEADEHFQTFFPRD